MAVMVTTDDRTLAAILNKTDLARLLDKSTRTIERLHRSGRLPEPIVPGRWTGPVIERWLGRGHSSP